MDDVKGYRDGCASCATLRAEVAREKARPRWVIGLSDESAGRFAGSVTLASLACAACWVWYGNDPRVLRGAVVCVALWVVVIVTAWRQAKGAST